MATNMLNVETRPEPAARESRGLKPPSLVSVIQAEIEKMIVNGELEPGERLNEVALAASFQVSRGPVREACRALAQAGLLDIEANRGFFARKLAQKDVTDLYDLRAGLMGLAGELLVKTVSEEQVSDFFSLVKSMEESRLSGDSARFRELNTRFHAALVQATDNHRLVQIYMGLSKEIQLFRRLGFQSEAAMEVSNSEHQAIVDAISIRDPARAAQAMRNHVLQGKERFLAGAASIIYD